VAAVGGPYDAFVHDRVAFIVDLEATVVHQPGPRPLDDPTPGEDDERVRVDAVDDLDREVPGPGIAWRTWS
jgi:hypothetical protein